MNYDLMTLEEAAAKLHANVRVSTLRKARSAGALRAVKIGKYFYTNEEWLGEYLNCPDIQKARGSISAKTNGNGSSATEAPRNGQASVLASLEKLKRGSQNTSRESKANPGAAQPIRES